MSTLLNRLTLLVSFAFSALCLQAADKKPFGLMTDLIEHTGQTWQNGYASNLPVWQLEEAIEPLQSVHHIPPFPGSYRAKPEEHDKPLIA